MNIQISVTIFYFISNHQRKKKNLFTKVQKLWNPYKHNKGNNNNFVRNLSSCISTLESDFLKLYTYGNNKWYKQS